MSLHIGYPWKPSFFCVGGQVQYILFQYHRWIAGSIIFQKMLKFFLKKNFIEKIIFWKFQHVEEEYYLCQTCYSTTVFHIILLSCNETFQNFGPVLDSYSAAKGPDVWNAPLVRALPWKTTKVSQFVYDNVQGPSHYRNKGPQGWSQGAPDLP
jgi:hypothetical protein